MQQERSISATYYLLQGKPSIQTIQDGQIYQLNKYFGIYKHLPKERFFEIVEALLTERLLKQQHLENFYEVTATGETFMEQHLPTSNDLNGTLYKNIDTIFFQRVLLLIQVFTHSKMGDMKFVPMVEHKEVEDWLKLQYRKWKHKPTEILQTLYDELRELLTPLDEIAAEVFVDQLSGYKHIGLTLEQKAHELQMSLESIHFIHINTIHYMLKKIQSEKDTYPLLHFISHDLFQQSVL